MMDSLPESFPDSPAGRAPTVLIVEDEPLLQILARTLLEDAGCETLSAADSNEAMRYLEQRRDISVVFTDVQMPGYMSGIGLAQWIRDRRPAIALVLTSGQSAPNPATLPNKSVFLPKPYNEDSLRRAFDKARAAVRVT